MREEHLRYVLEIAQTGSINKAAENLYISHQSLNRSLKTFENELGSVLFNRTQKGVELTVAGQRIIDKIDDLVSDYDELRALVNREQELKTKFIRTFTINCSSYVRHPFVSDITQKILASFPDVRLITKMCPTDILDLKEAFHLILTWDAHMSDRINREQTLFWNIAETEMYLIVSNEHKLAKYKETSLENTVQYPFVSLQLGAGLMNPLLEGFQIKQLTPNIALETDHMPSYLKAIKSGKYVGIWLKSALEMDELKHDSKLKRISIKDLPPLYICGLMSKESYADNEDIMRKLLKL